MYVFLSLLPTIFLLCCTLATRLIRSNWEPETGETDTHNHYEEEISIAFVPLLLLLYPLNLHIRIFPFNNNGISFFFFFVSEIDNFAPANCNPRCSQLFRFDWEIERNCGMESHGEAFLIGGRRVFGGVINLINCLHRGHCARCFVISESRSTDRHLLSPFSPCNPDIPASPLLTLPPSRPIHLDQLAGESGASLTRPTSYHQTVGVEIDANKCNPPIKTAALAQTGKEKVNLKREREREKKWRLN